jgi:hypothetical protein
MARTSALPMTPTANSSDRTPVLPDARAGSHPSSGRLAVFARRFISALMRSLAAPHV